MKCFLKLSWMTASSKSTFDAWTRTARMIRRGIIMAVRNYGKFYRKLDRTSGEIQRHTKEALHAISTSKDPGALGVYKAVQKKKMQKGSSMHTRSIDRTGYCILSETAICALFPWAITRLCTEGTDNTRPPSISGAPHMYCSGIYIAPRSCTVAHDEQSDIRQGTPAIGLFPQQSALCHNYGPA